MGLGDDMEYFKITQKENIPNVVRLMLRPRYPHMRKIAFEKNDRLVKIATIFIRSTENSVFPDMFDVPTLIVSDRLRKLLEIYDNDIIFKCAVLSNLVDNEQYVYFLTIVDSVDCAHKRSEFYGNGTLKKLVIDRNKADGNKIFRVKGVREHYIYVSLDVAESMLRRGFLGIHFEKVESL